ncbi:hypothetical protein ABMA27_012379 [Loxostege sticticalis]|uniref:Uncharacterized protein n=1 Tax=Loxostege sticticalis TaxID=481309 RepID=A0ABR3H129_LOXSC
MDKRNFKKPEQPDRKQDKKDIGATRRVEKLINKAIDTNTNDSKAHPERGDLKKADKPPKKGVLDTNDAKLPPDRGDLIKVEKQAKKVVTSDTKVIADRGDLKKAEKNAKKTADLDANHAKTTVQSDRGDSVRKIIKVDKLKLTVVIKNDDKAKNLERPSRENVKKIESSTVKPLLDEKRKIREKYTLKPKNPLIVAPSINKKDEQPKLSNLFKPAVSETKNARTPKKADTSKDKSDDSNESKQSDNTINARSAKKDSQRKPIIRTILTKNDTTKIYKAVTFVDQKKNKPTLQIKIPNEIAKNPKHLKSTESMDVKKITPTLSGVSIKEKTSRKKLERKKRGKRHIGSPPLPTKVHDPPTEVAKWAPSSINRHTKPYYEAWVSTTLAAISKNSKKDKLFLEKQNLLQSFQRTLAERPETPELMYENFTDERYTGRIKVKQR